MYQNIIPLALKNETRGAVWKHVQYWAAHSGIIKNTDPLPIVLFRKSIKISQLLTLAERGIVCELSRPRQPLRLSVPCGFHEHFGSASHVPSAPQHGGKRSRI